MASIKDYYTWEIELKSGAIIKNGNNFRPEDVRRISYIPGIILRPCYDIVFLDIAFVKRFSRAFMKTETGYFEYLHVLVTDKFRFYLFSSTGRVLITDKNYELYL